MPETAPSNSADGALNHFGRSALETRSGQAVDLVRPDPDTIRWSDITTALANTCRYGGHVSRYYSVAEHSVLVADLLAYGNGSLEIQLAGLLHDAAEAYCGDLIGPLKWVLTRDNGGMSSSQYTLIEQSFDRAIAKHFDIDPALFSHPAVKLADLWALRIEARELTVSRGEGWRWTDEVLALGPRPAKVRWAGGLPPQSAAALMETKWRELDQELG
jgi:5'-nucleotidase